MVSLRSNLDADLANKAMISEHLNHILNSKIPESDDDCNDDDDEPDVRIDRNTFPRAPRAKGLRIRNKEISPPQLALVQASFSDYNEEFPFGAAETKIWKKYCVREGLTVGAIEQTNLAVNRRDNTHVWFKYEVTNRLGRVVQRGKRFGVVILFAEALTWEAIAIIKPIKVVFDERFGTTIAKGSPGAMIPVRVSDIGGLIGRIETGFGGKKTVYLVGDWESNK